MHPIHSLLRFPRRLGDKEIAARPYPIYRFHSQKYHLDVLKSSFKIPGIWSSSLLNIVSTHAYFNAIFSNSTTTDAIASIFFDKPPHESLGELISIPPDCPQSTYPYNLLSYGSYQLSYQQYSMIFKGSLKTI